MEFFVENGETRVRQSFDAPTVYFDHWAIRDFSDDAMLQDRFVKAMLKKHGTFVLSHTNLAEFTGPIDPRNSEAAERFLERLMPNVYLTDFDLEKAKAFENQAKYAGERMWPSADLPMLKFVTERSITAGTGLTLMGVIILSYLYRERISAAFAKANQNILAKLNTQRADPAFVEKARRSVPDTSRPKTKMVMGELMRDWMLDSTATITANDIIDWQHSILPVSCCDYVLLDGKWEQRVQEMKRRTVRQGLNFKFAKCYSKRNDGLNRFLNDIESY